MMYVRYSLSLRQVEALLFERGIDVSMQSSTTSATASRGTCSVRLDRRIEGRQLPFDAVRERIADHLREHVWRRAVSQYLQLLIGQAEIRGIDLKGANTPLVQ
jgi:transposase-like protein